ncbi:MAG TPA: vanadium-dependent haloperoxidase [Candidatus Limnocylindrales bacterium]|nr:vanadium-dependent haloperoxidase [Candidatus Limnocylindrales bacterium]
MTRSRQVSRAQRPLAAVAALALAAATILIPAASVAAADPTDMVLDWNEYAIITLGNSPTAMDPVRPGLGQGPPVSAIHLAMVQGAVYDAVNAIDGTRKPYLAGLDAAADASQAAAAATAAHHVLDGLIPAALANVKASNDKFLTDSLGLIANGPAKTAGIEVGAEAAAAMLTNRVGDGRFGSHTFATSDEVGKWRLVPPANANLFGWAAFVKPFTMRSPDQFRTEGPLDIESAEYAAEFNEVKALGAQVDSSRTPEQEALARFVTANPLPFMNKGLRDVATNEGLSTSQQARLFALTSMASADALIGCWNDKDFWNVWRPQTAIREAADDGNPATEPDEDWLSFFATPGYPDHPSGYNCYTAAMMHGAKRFFGSDKTDLDLTSPGTTPPTTRQYDRFTDVIKDTIDGRIYTGFHFRTPDVQGAWLGMRAANWAASHYFKPAN